MGNKFLSSGYYGSISSEPRLVKHNVSRNFMNAWSDWTELLVAFLDLERNHSVISHYLGGPSYRYALSQGVCSEQAHIGVMVPNVDNEGNPSPFTICASLPKDCNPVSEHQRFNAWYVAAEKCIQTTKTSEFTTADLPAAMLELDKVFATLTVPESNYRESSGTGQIAIRRPLTSDAPTLESYQDILHVVLSEICFGYSIWYTTGNNSVDASMLLTQGLPPIDSVVAMFDGQWRKHGWVDDVSKSSK